VRGSEMRAVLKAMFHTGRMQVSWLPDDQPRSEAKLAFLILQCVEAALPYGGAVTVTDGHAGREIKAVADRMVIDETLWAKLSDPADTTVLRPAQVQFGLLAEQIQISRRRLQINLQECEIRVLI
jgi:histidine phosphotransferase ChpT